MEQGEAGMCKCPHHKFTSVLVVLFGLLFLGGTWGWWSSAVVSTGWPIIVILAGLMKMTGGMCKCCPGGAGMCKCR